MGWVCGWVDCGFINCYLLRSDYLAGLNYLHTQCKLPIIHCDVRSANILVRDLLGEGATDNITAKEIAKLTNFGLSRETTYQKLNCNPVVGSDATQYLDPAYVFP